MATCYDDAKPCITVIVDCHRRHRLQMMIHTAGLDPQILFLVWQIFVTSQSQMAGHLQQVGHFARLLQAGTRSSFPVDQVLSNLGLAEQESFYLARADQPSLLRLWTYKVTSLQS